MTLSEDLAWRGLIKDKTFTDNKWLDKPRVFYWGVDCSADSLTVGNLAPLLLSRRLAQAGWRAVLLVGGATSLIGDPGGKEAERPLLPRETVRKNVEAIKAQVTRLFADQQFSLADNYDWFKEVGYLEFLRDIGKHFPVTELIQRDFIAERLGEHGAGISYAEFSYSLIQAYDFWQLYKKHNVELQIGGSDQWGNMLAGVSLIRKKEAKAANAMSMPLIVNKATGKKFGKSEGGAVWLDPAKTSPAQFYQFWINADDADVEGYLKVFTFLSKEQIGRLMREQRADAGRRPAQLALAEAATALVHGPGQAAFAQAVSDFLVGKTPIAQADKDVLAEVRKAIPAAKIQPGTPVIEALVKTGLTASNSEARRLVQSQAVYVDGEPFAKDHLEAGDFKKGRLMLRRGKAYKDSALIELA